MFSNDNRIQMIKNLNLIPKICSYCGGEMSSIGSDKDNMCIMRRCEECHGRYYDGRWFTEQEWSVWIEID